MCLAIPGPTLLDLQMITNTTTEEITRIFTGRSVGYLAGSILSGVLFDKFNQDCLLSFALILTAVGTACAPWSHNYVTMMGLFASQGLSMGFLDTGKLLNMARIHSKVPSQYKDGTCISRYGDFHYKNKMVTRPSYLYNGNIIKIRWLWDHLIFIMGIPILVRRRIYNEMGPCLTGHERSVLSEIMKLRVLPVLYANQCFVT